MQPWVRGSAPILGSWQARRLAGTEAVTFGAPGARLENNPFSGVVPAPSRAESAAATPMLVSVRLAGGAIGVEQAQCGQPVPERTLTS